jgi:hypothetical protein
LELAQSVVAASGISSAGQPEQLAELPHHHHPPWGPGLGRVGAFEAPGVVGGSHTSLKGISPACGARCGVSPLVPSPWGEARGYPTLAGRLSAGPGAADKAPTLWRHLPFGEQGQT